MEYKAISLSDARAGMRVACDVCDSSGSTLLAAGAVLTEDGLATLAQGGITELKISAGSGSTKIAARTAALEQRLNVLFRNAGEDAALAKLRKIVLEYRLEAL